MSQPSKAPQAPPPPPTPRVTVVGGGESPLALYRAQVAKRDELRDQLNDLRDARGSLANELRDPTVTGADRVGLEARITAIDARMAAVDKQLADANVTVAQAAGVPGAIVEDPRRFQDNRSEDAPFVVGGIFIVAVLLPISLAFARRIWRRGGAVASSLPPEVMDRLTRLDHAVDSIAVEVERIGEGQRFVTRVLSDRGTAAPAALGSPPEARVPR